MAMDRPPTKNLARLAHEAEFPSAAALSDFTNVSPTVIHGAWNDNNWISTIQAANLMLLCRSVPAIQDYVNSMIPSGLAKRLKDASGGLVIPDESLARLRQQHPDQYLSKAVELLHRLSRARTDDDLLKVVPLLANFWQLDRGRALEAILVPAPEDAIQVGLAVNNARRLWELLISSRPQRGTPGPRPQARQVLAHYLTMRGEIGPAVAVANTSRDRLIDYRCGVMAAIGRQDDMDLAKRYNRETAENESLAEVERWMFPAWTGDVGQKTNQSLPPRGLLQRTGAELLREINSPKYSSAYIWYLATTYLPLALEVDRTIGLVKADIQLALKERQEDPNTSEETIEAIERIDARLSEA